MSSCRRVCDDRLAMAAYATIRGSEGEANFATREDVERALRVGLVSPSDEILLAGETAWQPVATVVKAERQLWRDHYHWYVLAIVLAGAWTLGVRFLGLLLIFGTHPLWMTTFRRRRGKSVRWW